MTKSEEKAKEILRISFYAYDFIVILSIFVPEIKGIIVAMDAALSISLSLPIIKYLQKTYSNDFALLLVKFKLMHSDAGVPNGIAIDQSIHMISNNQIYSCITISTENVRIRNHGRVFDTQSFKDTPNTLLMLEERSYTKEIPKINLELYGLLV